MSGSGHNDEHVWFAERLAAYLSGGLETGERARLEEHAAGCPACAGELRAAQEEDQRMQALFAEVRPAVGFEDRVIAGLRQDWTARLVIPPLVKRIAAGVAAAVVLAGIGYVGDRMIHRGALPGSQWRAYATAGNEGLDRRQVKAASNLRQIGSAMRIYGSEARLASPPPASAAPVAEEKKTAISARGGEAFQIGGQLGVAAAPFAGVQADSTRGVRGRPTDAEDLVLLPTDDDADGAAVQPYFRFKDGQPTASLPAAPSFMPAEFAEGRRGEAKGQPANVKADIAPQAAERGTARKDDVSLFAAQGQQAGGQAGAPARATADRPDAAEQAPATQRKIIRNGELEFEVESFDNAVAQVMKIVAEEGGFLASSESQKLPNGKTKGLVVVRVPPERLDTLVLKLRALGDLKSQRIGAQDISKQYTNLESQLRAARAMESRLLEIIKTGKGEIKDLVAAEKELGVWREKIERVEGEIRYYNNLIAMSTLSITLAEKDIWANIAPRQTMNLNLACTDVEQAYRSILGRVEKAGGRTVSSNLNRQRPEQTNGTITFEVRSADADAVLNDLRQPADAGICDLMKLATTENADTANVTTAKRGFVVQLVSLASVAPRESVSMQLAAKDAAEAYAKLATALAQEPLGSRVLASQLNEQDRQNVSGVLDFEAPRDQTGAVEKLLASLGDSFARRVSRSTDTESTVDSKIRWQVTLLNADRLPPRETTAMGIEVVDVEKAAGGVQALVASIGGRTAESHLSKERDGQVTSRLVVDVPLGQAGAAIAKLKDLGTVRSVESSRNPQVPEGALTRARLDVTLTNGERIVSGDQGLWATIRDGLATSVTGLLWSLQLIVVGLCLVAPWALIVWAGWRLLRRVRSRPVAG